MEERIGAEIATLIREINAGINQQMRNRFKDNALTPPQMMIMFMLAKEKYLKVSEISKKMSLANSTVSGIIDRLEKQGFVERVRSEEDKRVVYVRAATHMDEIHQDYHQSVTNFLAALTDDISKEEVTSIISGLHKLKKLVQRSEHEKKGD